MDLKTVKFLVEAYPDCLTKSKGYDYNSPDCYHPIHVLVENPAVGEHTDILRYLIEQNPEMLQFKDSDDKLPLHMALDTNDYATAEVVNILVESWPESVYRIDNLNDLPIHKLAQLEAGNNANKADILKILIEANPSSVQCCSIHQNLPIHYATRYQQPNFIRILAEAYPESVKEGNEDMELPFHIACRRGSFETVKYLYNLYPESINSRNYYGLGPVHLATTRWNDPTLQALKFLLDLDPDGASRAAQPDPDEVSRLLRMPDDFGRHLQIFSYNGFLPLHYACENQGIELGSLEAIKYLFDIHPEALLIKTNSARIMPRNRTRELGNFSLTLEGVARNSNIKYPEAATFLAQQVESLAHYKDAEFPIHSAIKDGQTLGVIKLLVTKWYEDHISLFDAEHNSPLHYACISGRIEVINYLLETQPVSGSGQIKDGKLPVEMLLEVAECGNRGSVEYTEAIWRLLVANPEALTGLLQ